MVISDLDRFVIINEMVPSSEPKSIIFLYGSVCAYLQRLRDLGVGDFVLMKFNGFYYNVPCKNSSNVFFKGGVFVNE